MKISKWVYQKRISLILLIIGAILLIVAYLKFLSFPKGYWPPVDNYFYGYIYFGVICFFFGIKKYIEKPLKRGQKKSKVSKEKPENLSWVDYDISIKLVGFFILLFVAVFWVVLRPLFNLVDAGLISTIFLLVIIIL